MGSKTAKLREQSDDELRSLFREKERELQDLCVKGKGQEAGAAKPVRRRILRREMARILTILHERGVRIHG